MRGALYTNPIDCLWKTFKTEGIAGWYKGTTAHFLRIFPHTVVTLVANEVGYVTSIEHTELTIDHHDAVPQGPDEVGIGVGPRSSAEK